MIIIEGLDGVGKSTVVDYLKLFGFSNLHYDYDSNNNDLMKKYSSIAQRSDLSNLIADRSFFSEMVYGSVLRNGSRISNEQFLQLHLLNSNHFSIFVVLKYLYGMTFLYKYTSVH